ncbi:MAG: nucleotide exchange factor GrpE [Deltaproteobacteria bacterium]|nr:MAG: nucleotide exchange factor GrpE [Deltaproteobacteria bacterium]
MTKPTDQEAATDISVEMQKAMEEAAAAIDDPAGEPAGETGANEATATDPEARIRELEQQVAELHDKRLRALADLENMKKRVRRDIDDAIARRTQEILLRLLPTVDNLERALEAAHVGDDAAIEGRLEQLIRGIEMVRDEFLKALAHEGIEPIDAVGKPFDPQLHDALHQEDSDEHPPGTVLREFEKGYLHGERLLRPARVIVAGPGSKGKASDDGS